MARLEGKTALITGGTTGIGLATAKRFMQEGARLAVTGRNEETMKEAKRQLGEAVTVIRSDAGNVADQAALAAQLGASFGKLDVVFINAGTGTFQPIEAIEAEEFDRQFAINVKGPLFLLKALSPLLNSPSSVILNASIAGSLGMPNTAIYAATKAALLAAMRVSAAEWAERNIRVNAISPGPITTPIYGKLGLPPDVVAAFGEQMRQSVPMKRFGDANEVANVAMFLASSDSSYVTGTEINVDGGRSNI
jgi:NAD(P)-dependent dehydrogenase (short-subunit alcohol dehydrogenase family)